MKICTVISGFLILLLLGGCTPALQPDTITSLPPTPAPTATAHATPTFLPAVDELAAFVSQLTEQGRFSGVVLVAKDDIILWEVAAGLADRQANIPNNNDTRFNLGSMNKMFTAVAILQLVEDGILSVDDTIGEILTDYPNTDVARQVTVHHLLTHTSGLGDVFTDQFAVNPNQYRSNQDFLPLFVDEPLQFSPGERFSYSNAGYVVLGLIIEKVSGVSYDTYVRQNIFEPSGMSDTAAFSVDDKVPNLAIGYTTQDFYGNETGLLADNTALMPGKGFAAGGGYSTAPDLLKFGNALFGNRLLSPAATDLLTTGKVEIRENSQYAYGFLNRAEGEQRMVGHSGGAPGVCSSFNYYPGTGYTVIVLSNSDSDCLEVLDYVKDHPLTQE